MKVVRSILGPACFLACLAACGAREKFNQDSEITSENVSTENFTPFSNGFQAAEKDWTFLVFLNGDNNLDSFGTSNMADMAKVGSNDKVNIIVLRDTYASSATTKIYKIEKGKQVVIKDFGKNLDTGDWNNLVDFYSYVKTNYPAKHYFVDIWNHGSGWQFNQKSPIFKGISYDDHSGNHITTEQLGMAMKKIKELNGNKNIDILGADACLMQMLEVNYEIKDYIDVFAASEEVEPGAGWDYVGLLSPLVGNSSLTAKQMGSILTDSYVKSYQNGDGSNATFSSLEMTKLTAGMQQFNAFVTELIRVTPKNKTELTKIVSSTQSYEFQDNKDLIHFINLSKAKITDAKYVTAANNLLSALKGAIFANAHTGSTMDNSNGLAIWIPEKSSYSSLKNEYKNLGFTQASRWIEFLDALLK